MPRTSMSTSTLASTARQGRVTDLRAQVRARAENRPGVYRMLGPGGEVLYVGKSIRVRARLLSYFRTRSGGKAAELVGHTHRVEWDYVPHEFAALIHEIRLIVKHRPPFNVQHRRDRTFCFLKLGREEAPRLRTVFEVRDDGAWYAGPFRGPVRVREVARQVTDLLELRDCAARTPLRFADQMDLFGHERTPLCLRADLQRCLAPCAGRCTRSAYLERVDLARRFLLGDADAPLTILRERMETAAARLQFEYAAELRDRAASLEAAREELAELRSAVDALSFIYEPPAQEGDGRVYIIHRGIIRAELAAPRTREDRERIAQRARAILRRPARNDVRPARASEILLLARWFRLRPHERQHVWQEHDAHRVSI